MRIFKRKYVLMTIGSKVVIIIKRIIKTYLSL